MKQIYFLIISVLINIISFTQISIYSGEEEEPIYYGWQIFTFGWAGIFNGDLITICWIANPLLIVSWIIFRKTKIAFTLSSLALILNIIFYVYIKLNYSENEVNFMIGYYLWTISIMIMTLGSYIELNKMKKPNR